MAFAMIWVIPEMDLGVEEMWFIFCDKESGERSRAHVSSCLKLARPVCNHMYINYKKTAPKTHTFFKMFTLAFLDPNSVKWKKTVPKDRTYLGKKSFQYH